MGWTRPIARQHADTMKFHGALGFKVVKKHPVHVDGEDRWRIYTLEKRLRRTTASGLAR